MFVGKLPFVPPRLNELVCPVGGLGRRRKFPQFHLMMLLCIKLSPCVRTKPLLLEMSLCLVASPKLVCCSTVMGALTIWFFATLLLLDLVFCKVDPSSSDYASLIFGWSINDTCASIFSLVWDPIGVSVIPPFIPSMRTILFSVVPCYRFFMVFAFCLNGDTHFDVEVFVHAHMIWNRLSNIGKAMWKKVIAEWGT